MSKEKLQNIINDFNPEDFIHFFREKNTAFKPRTEELIIYDDNDFYNSAKLGEIDFYGDANLIVCTLQTDKPLSERSGKKSQYEKGKKILKDTQSDSGIFIFYDKNGNFRFSLIYANYLGKKRDWSTFKRFTYFVSKEFTNKTFLLRIGDGDFSSMDNIKEAFSVEKVTKEFYKDIAYWYFWAVKEVKFPKDAEEEDSGRNMSVIRMITRIIFIWFMKERGLIRSELFVYERISKLLKSISPKDSSYYKAILQNLFFATLNTKINERKFRFNIKGWKNSSYMDHTVYRYEDFFKDKNDMLGLFKDVPFLNGGLFDCLDRNIQENGKLTEFRIDGFSDKDKGLKVPNFLFFADETPVDLNSDYGTKDKNYYAKGLINILSSYNFVIDENDPNDAEVALDPELLGKVFENLLASFNPETSSTARKATGSYYTPREIVDYMVTQSLKEYYKTNLDESDDADKKLDTLLSTDNHFNPFDKTQTKKIVELTDKLRIVDPAVGSGAFPMGILNKLVFILSKLDPDNIFWKNQQIKAVEENILDPVIRQNLKNNIEEQFADKNPDYGRKLYLIENCIYGVDIQQIAIEIAKLRFFISLLVDENIDKTKDNWGIKPLPNLDYKIMQGNSLLEEYKGIKLIDEKILESSADDKLNLRDELKKRQSELQSEYIELNSKRKLSKVKAIQLTDELNKIKEQIKKLSKPESKNKHDDLFDAAKESKELFEKIKLLREEFFIESERQKKDSLKNEIEEIEWKFIETSLKEQKKESEIDELKKIIRSNKKPYFLWHFNFGEVFNEKGGFDVVIGNPPYVDIKALPKDDVKLYFKIFKTTENRINLYSIFIEKGVYLLNQRGILTYINPNSILINESYKKIRKHIIEGVERIIKLPDSVFEFATVETIILLLKKKSSNEKVLGVYFANNDNIDFSNLSFTPFIRNEWRNDTDSRFNIFGNKKGTSILKKIQDQGEPLEKFVLTSLGITPYDKYKGQSKKLISNREFHSKTKLTKHHVPLISGKNIHPFYISDETEEYLKYGPWLGAPRDKKFFENPKIVVRQIVSGRELKIVAGYSEITHFFTQIGFSLISKTDNKEELKFILALLNSMLINFYHRNKFLDIEKVVFQKILIANCKQLPVKESNEQKLFVKIVDQIISKKSKGKDTTDLENQINLMVYKLYELTYDEVKIVDPEFWMSEGEYEKFQIKS